MLLRLLVVVDAHKEYVASVFGNLRRIFLAFNLVNGRIGGLIEFPLATPTSFSLGIAGASSALLSLVRQFDDECRLVNVATGNHHKVGIAFACGILAVDDVLISRPYICHRENARQ